jgi:hypothetical protein
MHATAVLLTETTSSASSCMSDAKQKQNVRASDTKEKKRKYDAS